ncbi:hypothetical protein J8273_7863 [Carpediemonas membranifera]|uniref:Uncharacterized protein n=1 Tax=Carpediemonas membranifera TaxID=201153 RepID=A0A8J6B0P8_9EUKA|nr:hypothetical protein J8273_7863 [Carpediemonas membranifera]|eukprot:KAG9390512.1 hypothetical protein J8273_7863 [Carpediemonas membranifera]
MVKSFRRVRLTNHILRQKHFHRAGEQLARTLGWTPRRLPRGIAPPRAAPTRLVVFYGSARFKTPRRVHPCAPYGRFAKSLAHIMRAFNITAEVRMTNEFRTSLVCPFCRARFRRTRFTRRTMPQPELSRCSMVQTATPQFRSYYIHLAQSLPQRQDCCTEHLGLRPHDGCTVSSQCSQKSKTSSPSSQL